MTVATRRTTEVFSTYNTADMVLTIDFVAEQRFVVLKVYLANAAVIMVFSLVSDHILLFYEATSAISVGTWERTVELCRLCSLPSIHLR